VESQLRGAVRMSWAASGLTCDVRIPLRSVHETALSRPALKVVRNDGTLRRRVLVVEDEVFIGLDVCEALEGMGYEALGPVGRVSEALDLIAALRPDAAVLDASLAGESSELLAARLTELRVPFVVCTGYGDFAFPGLSAPVLQKPLAPEALGRCPHRTLATLGEGSRGARPNLSTVRAGPGLRRRRRRREALSRPSGRAELERTRRLPCQRQCRPARALEGRSLGAARASASPPS
jgi:CheY-like chemotaxis protein